MVEWKKNKNKYTMRKYVQIRFDIGTLITHIPQLTIANLNVVWKLYDYGLDGTKL